MACAAITPLLPRFPLFFYYCPPWTTEVQMKRIRLIAAFALLATAFPIIAQIPQEKVDLDAIYKIKDEGLNRSQVMDTLSYLTDVYGARLTGSPQIKAAGEWAKKKLM